MDGNVIVLAEYPRSPVLVDLVVQTLDAESDPAPLVLIDRQQVTVRVDEQRSLLVSQPLPQPVVVPVTERPLVILGGIQGAPGRDGVDGAGTFITDNYVLTPTDLAAKQVELSAAPANPFKVELVPYGGIEQRAGVDFTVSGRVLSWSSLALELLLDAGSAFSVRYVPSNS